MANVTRVLLAMASQIGFGGAVESRMSRSYSETAAHYVRANVSRIENKYVSLIDYTHLTKFAHCL